MISERQVPAALRPSTARVRAQWWCALLAASLAVACAAPSSDPGQADAGAPLTAAEYAWLDRVTWGVNGAAARDLRAQGMTAWLERQLHPQVATLPAAVEATIAGLSAGRPPLDRLAIDLEAQRKAANAIADDEQRKAALKTYQETLTRLASESTARSLLRALYSPNQLQEQMTWFWFNHFNVCQCKRDLRAMVGDYEDRAIRPHALGRFRDLLAATMRHPAMLRYLDNEQNAAGRINENYARELMELHTLGVDGGYSQKDVQGARPRADGSRCQRDRQSAEREACAAQPVFPRRTHRIQPQPP